MFQKPLLRIALALLTVGVGCSAIPSAVRAGSCPAFVLPLASVTLQDLQQGLSCTFSEGLSELLPEPGTAFKIPGQLFASNKLYVLSDSPLAVVPSDVLAFGNLTNASGASVAAVGIFSDPVPAGLLAFLAGLGGQPIVSLESSSPFTVTVPLNSGAKITATFQSDAEGASVSDTLALSASTPEPATLTLLSTGAFGMAAAFFRRRSARRRNRE